MGFVETSSHLVQALEQLSNHYAFVSKTLKHRTVASRAYLVVEIAFPLYFCALCGCLVSEEEHFKYILYIYTLQYIYSKHLKYPGDPLHKDGRLEVSCVKVTLNRSVSHAAFHVLALSGWP